MAVVGIEEDRHQVLVTPLHAGEAGSTVTGLRPEVRLRDACARSYAASRVEPSRSVVRSTRCSRLIGADEVVAAPLSPAAAVGSACGGGRLARIKGELYLDLVCGISRDAREEERQAHEHVLALRGDVGSSRCAVGIHSAVGVAELFQRHLVVGKRSHIAVRRVPDGRDDGRTLIARVGMSALVDDLLCRVGGRLVEDDIACDNRLVYPLHLSRIGGRSCRPRLERRRLVALYVRHGDVIGGAKCYLQRLAAGHGADD